MKFNLSKFNLSYLWAILIAIAIIGWMFSDDFFRNSENNIIEEKTSSNITNNKNEGLIVRALKVKNTTINNEVRSNGYTEPEYEITLSSEIGGKISEIILAEGSNIDKGNVILEIDTGTLKQRISAAKRKIKASEATLKANKKSLDVSKKVLEGTLEQELIAAKANLKLAEKNLSIAQNLAKNNFSSELEIAKYNSEFENAKVRLAILENQQNYNSELDLENNIASLENAKYDLENSKVILANLENDLTNSKIVSPVSGKLENLFYDKGELISANTPVANILGLEKIKLVVKIPQSEIMSVEVGNTVLITLDNGEKYEGVVNKISSIANQSTRTFDVEILIDNKSGFLKGGMTAEAVINTNIAKAFAISPAHLIVSDNGDLFVKIVKDSKVFMQKVALIKSIKDKVYISGLEDNSILLTVGQGFVSENEVVNYKLESEL